jgi:hypothetical protein
MSWIESAKRATRRAKNRTGESAVCHALSPAQDLARH